MPTYMNVNFQNICCEGQEPQLKKSIISTFTLYIFSIIQFFRRSIKTVRKEGCIDCPKPHADLHLVLGDLSVQAQTFIT